MNEFLSKKCILFLINCAAVWCVLIMCCKKRMRVKNNVNKDQFSQLPDDVLVSILSLLPMKEAARTSVLSPRWCKLWTLIPNLNFDDGFGDLDALLRLNQHLEIEARKKYIDWVNSVLNSYQRTTVQEFRIRFDLDADYNCHIDAWVKFAFEKKVESLTMHFPVYSICSGRTNHCSFPALCNSTKQLLSHSLRKLDLEYIDISGDFIQHLTSNCPLLEELAIVCSDFKHLVPIKIDGSSVLCLKHLKIVRCSYVESIYLSAPNLSSFEYEGRVIDINYACVPNLVDVSLGGKYFKYIFFNFRRLSNYVTQLETLTLRAPETLTFQRNMMPMEFPELSHLRTLKLDVRAECYESMLYFAPLIKAAPSLHKLEVDLFLLSTSFMFEYKRKVEKISKCPHQCLREVDILGFSGETFDMEFIIYLLENGTALERITLDHRSASAKANGVDYPLERRKSAMEQAMCLKSEFSLGNKLVIL